MNIATDWIKSRKITTFFVILGIMSLLAVFSALAIPRMLQNRHLRQDHHFSREQMVEDTLQLASTIEEIHPDPYFRGGGRVEYFRRLQMITNAIPEEGMTRDEYIRLIRPFVAAVGDSHTSLWVGSYPINDIQPGGVPLHFGFVEGHLYVAGVPSGANVPDYTHLLGSALISVEGISFGELIERQRQLTPIENDYHAFQTLADTYLWYEPYLDELLPEWDDHSQVTVGLQLPDGNVQEIVFDLPLPMGDLIKTETRVALPYGLTSLHGETDNLYYGFLDSDRSVALLTVRKLNDYREQVESNPTGGGSRNSISATELFRSLSTEMKEANTGTLIIDMRDNQGGNDFMTNILLYFLYGTVDVELHGDELERGVCHTKRVHSGTEQQNFTRPSEAGVSPDYYFLNPERCLVNTSAQSASPELSQEMDAAAIREMIAPYYEDVSPTFYQEIISGEFDGYHRPQDVIVLVNARTFSAGAAMVRDLYIMGATLIGTPSGQAHSENYGNGQKFTLNNTRIDGGVSDLYQVRIGDPNIGRILPVHYPLTYQILASYNFDPNAELLYALDLLPRLAEQADD